MKPDETDDQRDARLWRTMRDLLSKCVVETIQTEPQATHWLDAKPASEPSTYGGVPIIATDQPWFAGRGLVGIQLPRADEPAPTPPAREEVIEREALQLCRAYYGDSSDRVRSALPSLCEDDWLRVAAKAREIHAPKETDVGWPWSTFRRLREECDEARTALAQARAERDELARKLEIQEQQTEARVQDALRLADERDALKAECERLRVGRDRDVAALQDEAARLRSDVERLTRERDEAVRERDELRDRIKASLLRETDRCRERDEAQAEVEAVNSKLRVEREGLRIEREESARLRTAPPVVALTDIEKAADKIVHLRHEDCRHTIDGAVLSAIGCRFCVDEVLRSCTRTLDREEIAKALDAWAKSACTNCGEPCELGMADAVLRALGQAQTEKAKDAVKPPGPDERCGTCGFFPPMVDPDEQPAPAPVDEAEVERVARAMRSQEVTEGDGQDVPIHTLAAPFRVMWENRARAAIQALGQREASVDVEAFIRDLDAMQRAAPDDIRALIAKHTRPGQRAKAGGETAFVPDWERVRVEVRNAIEENPVAMQESPSQLVIAHARREYERQLREHEKNTGAGVGDEPMPVLHRDANPAPASPAAREAEWTEEQRAAVLNSGFLTLRPYTPGFTDAACAAIAKAAPAFVPPIALPKMLYDKERRTLTVNATEIRAALRAAGLRVLP